MAYNIFYAVLCVFSYLAAGPVKTPSPDAPNNQNQCASAFPAGGSGVGRNQREVDATDDGQDNTRNGPNIQTPSYPSTNPFL